MALTENQLNNPEGIDLSNLGDYVPLLENLQGNILKPHGREHSVHLFIKFQDGQQSAVKSWIQEFSEQYVTSAMEQAQEASEYRRIKKLGPIFANFFLSAKGYEYLETPNHRLPSNPSFRIGMKNDEIVKLLSDPAVDTWDGPLQDEIHALILIADDLLPLLTPTVIQVCESLSGVADILQREDGFILRNEESNQVMEHFGFADGISQPLFIKRDINIALEKFGGSFDKWDPTAPLSLVLVEDPYGQAEDSYGSYLAYRKLEQNVKGFRQDQRDLATKLGVAEELAGALAVGRFPDGTPVVESNTATYTEPPNNNFNYDEDPQNMIFKPTKCPFHAHIRKSNPRGDTSRVASSIDPEQDKATERGHRIARRGISYGINDLNAEPETGSGLLFLCFQANLDNQFNFIQSKWANKKDFVDVNVGLDPVIGQPAGTGINQAWPETWGGNSMTTEQVDYNFDLWVNMKGGEYFFAPSVSFLKNITNISFE